MSDNITAGCIVSTDFVTSGSTIFSGYIDYIDRETAVRNEHISDYSIYTDYMDNPEKTTELFTANSNRLSNEEKQQLKALYEKAQENGSPMWQTVISFDNRWLEKHGIYNAEEGFLDVPLIHDYTRRAVNKMLTKEGLELATWSAAIHYNTDNFHVHIATVEPIPTRPIITVKTVQFSSEWISRNNIIQDENIDFGKKVAAHRNKNYGYRSICNRLKNTLESEGYNTRYLGDYIAVNANGTINLSFNGDNSNLPFHSTLIDEHKEYKGKFKQSSIDSCKSTMVNQILENELNNKKLNEVLRNQLAAAIKGDILLENRDIVNQFLKVYDNLPDKKGYWQYNNNEYIGKLRPDIDKITEMYLEQYKAKEFYELKEIIDHNDSLYREAYGLNSETNYSRNKYKELYTRCGNAILSVMKNISFRELDEIRSNTYISAEVEEAAITGEHIDFDGIINNQPVKSKSQSKFWTDEFKEARQLIYAGTEELIKNPDSLYAYTLFKDAENLLTEEIEKGNSIAAYELGRCYKLGTFGNIDLDLSSKYYKTAFDGFITELNSDNWLNNMIALDELGKSRKAYSQKEFENKFREITRDIENDEWMQNYLHYRVGRMLLDGDGTEKNIKEGISHLEQSTSAFAHYTLGNIYYYGNEETEQDYELAYQHFSDAGYPEDGEKPVPFAVYNMAEMLSKELVQDNRLNKDLLYSKALSLFIASDENENNDLIEYRIASMLLEGKGCKIDEERAEKYLLKSAVFGNTYAQTKLANLYIKSGNPDLAERAVFLLQRAADSDNDVAQYQLGRIEIDKKSKHFNPEHGIELLTKSTMQGNDLAEYTLGKIYCSGEIIKQNVSLGLNHLSSCADKNNQFAQYTLGVIYLNGDIVEKDIAKSINYLEQSSDNGNSFAKYKLGMIYYNDNTIEQDINLAIKYLEQSAEQDNQYALYSLGKIYLENEDIRDMEKGISLFEQSAESGNPFAAYTLGNLYSKEELLNKDLADKWYSQAYEGFTAIDRDESIDTDDSVLYNLGIMNYKGLGTDLNVEKAIQYFSDSSEAENQFAQYQLGKIFIDETSEYFNPDKGIELLEKSANQDNEFAQYTLGNVLLKGNIVEKDFNQALKHLTSSAEKGNPFAQYALGIIYLDDKNERIEKDLPKAIDYFNHSSEQGNIFAAYHLGKIYLEEDEVKDIDKAIEFLTIVETDENQLLQYNLGKLYLENEDIRDVEKGISLLEQSAESGNPFAAYTLGNLYSKEELLNEDLADKWYSQAYEGFTAIDRDESIDTDDSVLYNLGIMNYKGLGTEINIEKSLDYLLKAGHQDHEYAQYIIGNIYFKGEKVKQHVEYAKQWLEPASDKGNQFAQYQLGKIYLSEEYGFQDLYKSIRCFEQSAEQGNQFSQYQLGMLYLKGDVINQNGELAIHYLEQAANQENEFAQYALGTVYLKGEITDIDYNKAIAYFEQSAEQNNSFAQYQLGKLYFFGADGIEVNKELALDYLNKSAAQGNEYAKALLEWKPGTYANFFHQQSFSETMVSLSSDMKMLFDRLANEHDHMLNQMVYENLMRKEEKEDIKEQ